jgi:hypothetical protein
MNPQAANIFRARYRNAPNVLTPVLVKHRMVATGKLAVELSRSAEGDLWGVTVLRTSEPDAHCELNKAFSTQEEAEAYIETLRSKA